MFTWLKRLLGAKGSGYKQQKHVDRSIPIAVDADLYGQAVRQRAQLEREQQDQRQQLAAMENVRAAFLNREEQEAAERRAAFKEWKENAARVNALMDRQAVEEQRSKLYLVVA